MVFMVLGLNPSPLTIIVGDGYSLEEARRKREEDKLVAAADAKKQGVRAYVQELRKYGPASLPDIAAAATQHVLMECQLHTS